MFSQLLKPIEAKHLSNSFAKLLYLASRNQNEINREIYSLSHCGHQQRDVLLLTNIPDLSMTL